MAAARWPAAASATLSPMPTNPAADLGEVRRRLEALLEPYRAKLDEGPIYGLTVLRRRGAKGHDWFAGVQPVDGAVKLNFLPMHAHPGVLEGASPALLRRRTGASVFRFTELDDGIAAELATVLARGFEAYIATDRSGRAGS